jgi:Protein of unknown function (DUF2852)
MAIAEKYYDERVRSPMPIASTLDEIGRPAWIVLMILGFMVWWPLGLAALAFLIASGRMSCARYGSHWEHKMGRLQDKMDQVRDKMDRHMGGGGGGNWWGRSPSSGNRAFDEYRADTLRRLEDEQREFREFLQRLRFARDRAEFDQFMSERRDRPDQGAPHQV